MIIVDISCTFMIQSPLVSFLLKSTRCGLNVHDFFSQIFKRLFSAVSKLENTSFFFYNLSFITCIIYFLNGTLLYICFLFASSLPCQAVCLISNLIITVQCRPKLAREVSECLWTPLLIEHPNSNIFFLILQWDEKELYTQFDPNYAYFWTPNSEILAKALVQKTTNCVKLNCFF